MKTLDNNFFQAVDRIDNVFWFEIFNVLGVDVLARLDVISRSSYKVNIPL